jgi:hypothetical protein
MGIEAAGSDDEIIAAEIIAWLQVGKVCGSKMHERTTSPFMVTTQRTASLSISCIAH